MWYPRKAAFRAGEAGPGTWDDVNVGLYSVAMGRATTADGEVSYAMGQLTQARGTAATAMGWGSSALADYSTAMGAGTTASGRSSTAMGDGATASQHASTAMGASTTASGPSSTAMGLTTIASGTAATAMGSNTTAGGDGSTAMGSGTAASASASTAMGTGTQARGSASTAMGQNTSASGQASFAVGSTAIASGLAAFAAGDRTEASGHRSVALGSLASTSGFPGAFVYGDFSTNQTFTASASNQFSVRASGGVRFFTHSDLISGVTLAAGGGSWSTVSDRNRKEAFLSVDGEDVLARILELPVSTWRYIAEEDRSVRHMGPMAQDWSRAFGFSPDSLTINTGDFDGVNLAAAQALTRRTDDLREADTHQTERIRVLEAENAALRARLERIEEMLTTSPPRP
jgi:autotransporter adhesin